MRSFCNNRAGTSPAQAILQYRINKKFQLFHKNYPETNPHARPQFSDAVVMHGLVSGP